MPHVWMRTVERWLVQVKLDQSWGRFFSCTLTMPQVWMWYVERWGVHPSPLSGKIGLFLLLLLWLYPETAGVTMETPIA
jgi:hypothetical protein